MTTLSVSPSFPVFTDRDGSPLENGYIWIGTAALAPITNPISVYWDAALTQLAAQPIRTLNGYPSNNGTPARLYVGSDYSMLVQDAKGTLVYSSPNATERWSDVVVTGADASEVTFLQAGTGADPRTVQAKLREWISPEDFGAVGDGNNVDTTALQEAINTGKNVRGTPGATYLIGPLTANTVNQTFDFSGCILKRINASSHGAMLTLGGARSTVIGGRWDGNKAGQSGSAGDKFAHAAVTITGDDCAVLHINDVNSWGIGIKGAACAYPIIRANRSTAADLYGIYIESTAVDEYGCDITGNVISSVGVAGASGIYLTGSNAPFTYKQRDWTITNNLCTGDTTGTPTGIAITTRGVDGVISGNRTIGYTMGISADIAQITPITGNRCVDAAGGSAYGIELNGANCNVVGNVIRGGRYGIIGSGNSTTQDYSLIGSNLISGPSIACIYFNGVTQPARFLNINGNTLIMSGATTGRRGVLLEGDCADSMIHNNMIAGPGSAVANCRGVYLDSVPNYISVIGNRFSGWEKVMGLYAGSAFTYTDITFNNNDCTRDCGTAVDFVAAEGSATIGARVVQMWNPSGSGVNYNVLDKQALRLLQWSATYVTPESNVTGGIGSLYINLNGGAGTTLFVKQSGAGNTGWAGK
jgi:hypothetical protein